MTDTSTTGLTAADALKAYTAFQHGLDGHDPLTPEEDRLIDMTLNAGNRMRDGFLYIALDPDFKGADLANYIAGKTEPAIVPGLALNAMYSPRRPVPEGRATRAVRLLDAATALNPNTHTEALAIQASLLWFDGRSEAAQDKAVAALEDDPWNSLALSVLKCTIAGTRPFWTL